MNAGFDQSSKGSKFWNLRESSNQKVGMLISLSSGIFFQTNYPARHWLLKVSPIDVKNVLIQKRANPRTPRSRREISVTWRYASLTFDLTLPIRTKSTNFYLSPFWNKVSRIIVTIEPAKLHSHAQRIWRANCTTTPVTEVAPRTTWRDPIVLISDVPRINGFNGRRDSWKKIYLRCCSSYLMDG